MVFFQSKTLIFLSHAFLGVIDFANLFLTDILMYETTTGIKFDFNAMFHNLFFWVLLALHILHIIITTLINRKNSDNDQAVEEAIAKNQIELLSQATSQTEKGEFEKARKVMKMYDQLAKRRNR